MIPEVLSSADFWLLVAVSFFTSFITAAVGIGGGTVLLAVMAQVVPVKAIIPVHGFVQLGSAVGRTLVMYASINKALFGWFLLGCIVGAFIGGQIVVTLPVDVLRVTLGLFILYSTWGPKLGSFVRSTKVLAFGGLATTTLTMFVGATGPFVMSLLRPFQMAPIALVGTFSACIAVQHLAKILVFGLIGFAFGPYLPLIALMIATGFIGTLLGKRHLLRVEPKKFALGLNIVLTLLALRLIAQAVL